MTVLSPLRARSRSAPGSANPSKRRVKISPGCGVPSWRSPGSTGWRRWPRPPAGQRSRSRYPPAGQYRRRPTTPPGIRYRRCCRLPPENAGRRWGSTGQSRGQPAPRRRDEQFAVTPGDAVRIARERDEHLGLPVDDEGYVDPGDIKKAIRKNTSGVSYRFKRLTTRPDRWCRGRRVADGHAGNAMLCGLDGPAVRQDASLRRSEERRVGKECRSRWSPYH